MTHEQELKCPGEIYTVSPVVCRERQRRGWNKCRVCPHATLEEVVSIKPAQQAEGKREPRRRNYYLVKKN